MAASMEYYLYDRLHVNNAPGLHHVDILLVLMQIMKCVAVISYIFGKWQSPWAVCALMASSSSSYEDSIHRHSIVNHTLTVTVLWHRTLGMVFRAHVPHGMVWVFGIL